MTPSSLRQLLQGLAATAGDDLFFDVPLSSLCSWRIGGPADVLVEPRTVERTAEIIRFARRHAVPLLVIGQGTNLLFDDAGLRGIVLRIGKNLSHLSIEGDRIVAGAGLWVPRLAREACRAGLAGLEHLIGIPGTLGGLVLMNGGSRRKGVGDNVVRVTVVDREGEPAVLGWEECGFSYRHSALQQNGATVVEAQLMCPAGDRRVIRHEMLLDLRERRRKFPLKEPNCGSVFLSTAQMHATVGPPGKIIEEAGLKGMRIGGAEVSRRHANFIVNRGEAASRDVLALIGFIRETVRRRIGFDLRCEVRYVSAEGDVMPADRAEIPAPQLP